MQLESFPERMTRGQATFGWGISAWKKERVDRNQGTVGGRQKRIIKYKKRKRTWRTVSWLIRRLFPFLFNGTGGSGRMMSPVCSSTMVCGELASRLDPLGLLVMAESAGFRLETGLECSGRRVGRPRIEHRSSSCRLALNNSWRWRPSFNSAYRCELRAACWERRAFMSLRRRSMALLANGSRWKKCSW